MTVARRWLPDGLSALLLALAAFLAIGHSFLNYDSFYALVWGNDVAHGHLPSYEGPVAPTPHPLAIAAGAAASLFGDAGEGALLALGLIAIGALGVGLFRLGQELYGWPVGLLAAGIILTRLPILNYGSQAYIDLPTVALIIWAAVLEARRPRRGVPVLVLLTLAGLLRPEAWLFAGLYWLWIFPRFDLGGRLRLAALAASAPILWGLSDLLVTGDPLWSLTETTTRADELRRLTGLGNVPQVLPRRLGEILRLPELIASVLGFAAGLVWLRRRTLLPAALVVLNGTVFLIFAAVGLPLLGRYLLLAGAVLALFAALAAFGWLALPATHQARSTWRVGGFAVIAAICVFVPQQVGRLAGMRDNLAKRDRIQADLRKLADRPDVEAALRRCRPLYVPNHRPVPSLAYWTGMPADEIISAQLRRPPARATFLAPATAEVERLWILDPHDPKRLDAEIPAGYHRIAGNRSWLLYGGCR